MDRLEARPRLAGALAAITAAVVGVILNLALWFGLHVLFAQVTETGYGPLKLLVPELASLDLAALVLFAAAALALFRLHLGVLPTLVATAALGAVYQLSW